MAMVRGNTSEDSVEKYGVAESQIDVQPVDELPSSTERWIKTTVVSFLPAILYWPVWIFAMTSKGVWHEAFSEFYPMSLCMVLGCLIAGSCPIGGAVVAFPVAVLILRFTPVQGRDFAAYIQSIGMVAATYLIFVRKRHMVNLDILIISCVGGTLGVLIGFVVDIGPFWVNIIYMVYTLAFAWILLYSHILQGRRGTVVVQPIKPSVEGSQWIKDDSVSRRTLSMLHFGLFLAGIIGGVLTSKVGSGSDTVAFVYGIFGYNMMLRQPITEASLTATSVCIMGYVTVVVAAIRELQGDVHRDVYLCWGAVSWIVVAGAPLGSLVLTEQRQFIFRRLFYILAFVQFLIFALVKIEGVGVQTSAPVDLRRDAWLVIGVVLGSSLSLILGHFVHTSQGRRKQVALPDSIPQGQATIAPTM